MGYFFTGMDHKKELQQLKQPAASSLPTVEIPIFFLLRIPSLFFFHPSSCNDGRTSIMHNPVKETASFTIQSSRMPLKQVGE